MWESFEQSALENGYLYPVGIDEAGRGPLAGPVVAAACYLESGVIVEGINDSKKISAKKREEVYHALLSHEGVKVGVAEVQADQIDEINILEATFKAMLDAVSALSIKPDLLLVDGNRAPKTIIDCQTIIKGDARAKSIAAASIVAKYHRDKHMEKLHEEYPQYGFNEHKGYPTKAHLEKIQKYGPSPVHRLSFAPLKNVYNYCRELI